MRAHNDISHTPPAAPPAAQAAAQARATRRRHSASPPAFALPVVLLLVVVSVIVLTVMLARVGDMRRAAERQIDTYRFHHTRAGVQEMLAFWTLLYTKTPAFDRPDGVFGFDIALEGGSRLTIRLIDAQGTPIRTASMNEPGLAQVVERAGEIYLARSAKDPGALRWRGPGQLSLHAASREALEALAQAAGRDATPGPFADEVLSRRAQGRLKATDITSLVDRAGLDKEGAARLTACLTVDPQLWLVRAEATDPIGNIISSQAGLALGYVKREGGVTGTSNTWTMLTWGKASDPLVFAGIGAGSDSGSGSGAGSGARAAGSGSNAPGTAPNSPPASPASTPQTNPTKSRSR
jgi:hypothetical protein